MADGRTSGFDSGVSQAAVEEKKRGEIRSEELQRIINNFGTGFEVKFEEEDEKGFYITIQHKSFLTDAEPIELFRLRMKATWGSKTEVKSLTEKDKYIVIVPK